MEKDIPEKLLDSLPEGIYYVGKDVVITAWNKTAEKITGYTKTDVLGHSCASSILRHMDITGHELCENSCPLQKTLQDGQEHEAHLFLHHKKGYRVPVHVRINPVRDEDGGIIGAIETFSDDSKELDMLKQIKRLEKDVYQDPLLEIGNRRFLEKMFETHAYKLGTPNATLGIMYFDIDYLKHINDVFGHLVGDETLVMVSQSVMSVLRQSDSLFRWGGDEFLVLLPNINHSELKSIAERIKVFVERSFIKKENEKISVTVSIGATFVKPKETLASCIKRSDSLMYIGKSKGKNTITIG